MAIRKAQLELALNPFQLSFFYELPTVQPASFAISILTASHRLNADD
jgi:hypothetical protein